KVGHKKAQKAHKDLSCAPFVPFCGLSSDAGQEVGPGGGEDYQRRPSGHGWSQHSVVSELLKPAAHRPVSNTNDNGRTQSDYSSLPSKRHRQRHSDKSHDDDSEWARVFPLQRNGQSGNVHSALFRSVQVTL